MLKTSEEFVTGKRSISYVSDSFKERFYDTTFEPVTGSPSFQKLPRTMKDAEIESELKPGLCTLGDVLAFLENPPEETKDGNWNLFYTEKLVVSVDWDGGDWGVSTWKRDGNAWRGDLRVFSPAIRNSNPAPTLPLRPSDSLTFEISELTKQIKRIADMLEKKPKKVIKKKK